MRNNVINNRNNLKNRFNRKMLNPFFILLCLMAGSILSGLSGCAKQNNFKLHLKNPQDATAYLNPLTENKPIITASAQKALFKTYLKHYYSPWSGKNRFFSIRKIKKIEQLIMESFTKDSGWNENRHPHTKIWIQKIIANMNMNDFGKKHQKAITTESDSLRTLPTHKPSFSSMTKPGNTYPFDNLQASYLSAGLPVVILQTTKDGAWDFVLTNAEFGWLPSKDLAKVNSKFIKTWSTPKYIAFHTDHTSIYDTKHIFRFISRLGTIYPLKSINKKHYTILIPVSNANREAVIKKARINKKEAFIFPLLATPKNIATISNQFLGGPYGWGGLYGYRDCSETTMNLMAAFGVWLPRNSSQQEKMGGRFISFKNKNSRQKQSEIKKEAIPFFTLIRLPGHVMLYVGKTKNHLYVLHDMWGLHTMRPFQSAGRAVVGKTVITPLSLGKGYLNVPQKFIGKVRGIVLLGEKSSDVNVH